jgi:hypothetical protein
MAQTQILNMVFLLMAFQRVVVGLNVAHCKPATPACEVNLGNLGFETT